MKDRCARDADGERLLRGTFEQFADQGLRTAERYEKPQWGFYEIKSEDYFGMVAGEAGVEEPLYERLVGLDHEEAKQVVKKYNDEIVSKVWDTCQ